ncbi:hypothetical protein M409DRAFT_29114 [Zasmidium cellare ATCC 36951]|uniref:2'-phosphotransferase n=1 Tax=Zasmidium cellare ATCC 36951 TaxID=1080233 RepID=A0A6A6C0T9_ZASCE|nr:uncharacterized protein M409DRAFT_29114 [Zasmidium cellare ATCC 36951]KAF2160493.1 hypothetical protein M409DRAFT_29114 [Zasmidium cellare ATCC 36951]
MPGRGGGGRGGNRGGGPLPRPVQVSKKISWLLRHGAEKEGLTLGPGGYINVSEVLANRNLKSLKVTFDELRQIVEENDKQRFTMVAVEQGEGQTPLPSNDPKDYLIRANQGHSLKVEEEGLLQPITEENLPATVVHGTTHSAWPLIVSSGGLKPMGRNHVHFASGLPAGFTSLVDSSSSTSSSSTNTTNANEVSAPVISGMRKSSTVLVFLDVVRAMQAGIKFWVSDNGVVLTEGNEEGVVPLEFFRRVEDLTGEGVLVEEGRVVKEAPGTWNKGGGRS